MKRIIRKISLSKLRNIAVVFILLFIGLSGGVYVLFVNWFPSYQFTIGEDSLSFRHPFNWYIPSSLTYANSNIKTTSYDKEDLHFMLQAAILPRKIISCENASAPITYCKLVTNGDFQRQDITRIESDEKGVFHEFETIYNFTDRSYTLHGWYSGDPKKENLFLVKELEYSVRSLKYHPNLNVERENTNAEANSGTPILNTSTWSAYSDDRFKIHFSYPEQYEILFDSSQFAKTSYPIYVSVTYLHDLTTYDSQHQGMAGNISSQESFNKFRDALNIVQLDHVSVGTDKALLYIGGSENFKFMKQYRIIHGDYLISFIADATTLLKNEHLKRDELAKNNYELSEKAPADVKDFFNNFDLLVQSVDLSNLNNPEVAGSFDENAIPDESTIFDDCGKPQDYSNDTWYQSFVDSLEKDGKKVDSVTDMCFSASENTVIATLPGGYCQVGQVVQYSTADHNLRQAKFLNEYLGCVTSPSIFEKRVGNYIEMVGRTGDADCMATVYFQYDFQNNLVRKYKSDGSCEGSAGEKPDEFIQVFY